MVILACLFTLTFSGRGMAKESQVSCTSPPRRAEEWLEEVSRMLGGPYWNILAPVLISLYPSTVTRQV